MRNIAVGFSALLRRPVAALPLLVESVLAGLLIGLAVWPADGGSSIAAATFPLDVYFDVKRSMSFDSGWVWFCGAVAGSVALRSAALGATLWLAEANPGSFLRTWARSARLALLAAAVFFVVAGLYFTAVVTRYAPFIVIAALPAALVAVALARRGVSLDVGWGTVGSTKMPELGGYLVYAYLLCACGAAMVVLARVSAWWCAIFVMLLGPLHAATLLGWRAHVREGIYPRDGKVALAVTLIATLGLALPTIYDRLLADPTPRPLLSTGGELLLLGGVDSTSKTGSLARFDPRVVGYGRSEIELLTYKEFGKAYVAADTHRNLDEVARVVAAQISDAEAPRALLGHSQAAPILDRIAAAGLTAPDVSAVIAPPPRRAPPVDLPPPGRDGPGRVGGDFGRAFSGLLEATGLGGLSLDAPAAPTNVEPVGATDVGDARLAVWALGDSLWLDADWRRPGETNLVAMTDHVGSTRNGRALEASSEFFAGHAVASDAASWRSVVLNIYKYAFEPWRP